MRCCASPTTSTAANPVVTLALRQAQGDIGGPAQGPVRDPRGAMSARDVVGALLFREILKPLAHGLGPVGEIALGAVADDLFVRRVR